MRRPVWASSSPRSIRSQRESAVGRRTTRGGSSPVCPETAPHASAATVRSFVPRWRAIVVCPSRVEKIARLGALVLAEAWESRALLPASAQWGPPALASTRRPCGVGGRAFRGLTRSATEWSAARRKPLRAAALHISATISADVRPVGFRRATAENFPSGNFRSARDLEGAERVNPRKARLRPLRPRLLQRNEECPHQRRAIAP
jgi:hypothetical protein